MMHCGVCFTPFHPVRIVHLYEILERGCAKIHSVSFAREVDLENL
jgi:hypothetical protein